MDASKDMLIALQTRRQGYSLNQKFYAVEGVDCSIEELTQVWGATNDQDRAIVEENQKSILSPAYEPGLYAPEYERGSCSSVDWYCRAIECGLRGDVVEVSQVA